MIDPDLLQHYMMVREEARLTGGPGRLEFARTWELLDEALPPPPRVLLDVGGAAGVYALPLAARGYQVHLVDALEHHVRLARQASERQSETPLASVEVGDARTLAFSDEAADAVLLLGPLYHLTERDDRLNALREAWRVARSGGVVVAAAISRFASTCDGLFRGFLDQPGFEAVVEGDLRNGVHRNPENRPEWFTTAFFHHPDELSAELAEAGFVVEDVVAVEGPAWLLPDLDERWDDPERRERLLRAVRRIQREPTLMGATGHMLAMGRKP